jgi:hypothetical protein
MRALLLFLSFFADVTIAGELTVFDVRKPVTLSDKEVAQKDFYIDSGSEAGLQTGMIVTVVRKVPLYDTYQSRSAGDLKVDVAKVRIIHVQQGLSVARFAADVPRADIPILEDNFIMIGDHLDMTTATRDKKTASNGEETPAAPLPAAPVPTTPPPAPAAVTTPEPAPAPAQVTSQKVEIASPKDPGITPVEGPAVQ